MVKIDGANFRRAFAELKEGRPTTIFLPPSRPHTTPVPLLPPAESGNMKAFALLAEVMVKKVRVYLRGAKTSDRQFAISITHGGVHEVVRRDSEEFVFTSVPVHLLFKYEENIDGTTKINFDGNIAESGDESRYAPLSPFGWWRISIDRITNSGLDLSGLMSVDLEFHGDAYSFPSYSSSQK